MWQLLVISITLFFSLGVHLSTYASDSLTLELSGVIEDKCIIDTAITNHFDFSHQSSHSTNLQIDCNQPMLIALRSDNGGMRMIGNHKELVSAYEVKIGIESLNFTVKQKAHELLQEQRFATGSTIPFKTTGILEINLIESMRFAGEYRDTLHIDVYPNFVINGM